MNLEKLIPHHIRTLGGYAPGKSHKQAERESGVPCEKMASNENPFGPSPRATEAMREAAGRVHLYPENDAPELRAALAARHNMEPEHILVTCGSTQFLDLVARTLLAPGLNAVTSERSFIVYPIATKAAGGTLKQLPMVSDTFDLDAILSAIDENTRLVFIANPNNPTGTLIDSTAMDRFIARVPDHVLVVLDEAYYEFADHFAKARGREYSRSLDYVREGRNVLVLRTFSKAQGLAGVRVGYGFGPIELMQYFARVRVAFSISEVAQAGALAALEDQDHIRRTLENNAAGAAYLTAKLSAMGVRVVPTWSNFLYVELSEGASEFAKRLQCEGLIVRPLTGSWGAPNAIRITVGTPEQNEKLVAAMAKALESATVLK